MKIIHSSFDVDINPSQAIGMITQNSSLATELRGFDAFLNFFIKIINRLSGLSLYDKEKHLKEINNEFYPYTERISSPESFWENFNKLMSMIDIEHHDDFIFNIRQCNYIISLTIIIKGERSPVIDFNCNDRCITQLEIIKRHFLSSVEHDLYKLNYAAIKNDVSVISFKSEIMDDFLLDLCRSEVMCLSEQPSGSLLSKRVILLNAFLKSRNNKIVIEAQKLLEQNTILKTTNEMLYKMSPEGRGGLGKIPSNLKNGILCKKVDGEFVSIKEGDVYSALKKAQKDVNKLPPGCKRGKLITETVIDYTKEMKRLSNEQLKKDWSLLHKDITATSKLKRNSQVLISRYRALKIRTKTFPLEDVAEAIAIKKEVKKIPWFYGTSFGFMQKSTKSSRNS